MDPKQLQFGEFVLDCARYELRRGDRPVKLEKIPMELLTLLATSEGRLVTREEIEDRIWGKGVFVDAEHGINTAVRKIRQALGDSAGEPRFLQTVQKKGYRFVAKTVGCTVPAALAENLARTEKVAPQTGPTEPSPAIGKVHWKRRALAWGIAAAGIALAGIGYKAWPTGRASAELRGPAIRSIAVLPLENLSGKDDEYFADGMTDELITALAKHPGLRVTSRTSVMHYKKTNKTLPEIAQELGVDAIVEGSVARSAERVRVRAQLIQAATDKHLWAESYDKPMGDALEVQEDFAHSIASRVSEVSSQSTGIKSTKRASINPAARDAYFKGRYYWFSEQYVKSREFFAEAIRLEPTFAAAYSGMADSFTADAAIGEVPAADSLQQAESFARKALELDDLSAEAHHAQGAIKFFYYWDWAGANKEIERAIELNPSLAEAHHLRAYVLSAMNQTEESLAEDKRSMEIDPFARPWAYGYALIRARRFDEALEELREKAEARPESGITRWFLSDAYFYKGDTKSAMEELKKVVARPGKEKAAARIGQAFERGGYEAVFQQFLDDDKLKAKKEYVSPLQMAENAARAGKKNEAIEYLEKACTERTPFIVLLQHSPQFDSLHSDPRYWAIVQKMGMTPLQ
ncbi:MAG TPA: winged helix-turn-helix domain-containing protein [Candidatus Acidoferrum sp.]|nr:winged helix-turn-helix domain-containing protein [Candidatus Acidoferrum sp.]